MRATTRIVCRNNIRIGHGNGFKKGAGKNIMGM